MTYDEMLEKVGSFGLYQKRLFVVFFVCGLPNGMLLNSILYLHYIPDHHCTIPTNYYTTENLTYNEFVKNISLPNSNNTNKKCQRYNLTENQIDLAYSSDINISQAQKEAGLIECDQGWTYVDHNQIRSPLMEFDAVCNRGYEKPLVSAIFFWGMSLSNLIGFLGDRFGRRPIFLIFTFLQFITTFLASFATGTKFYAAAMFFGGLTQMTNYLVAFVIGVECTTRQNRNFISVGSFVSFSIGMTMTSGLFYFLSDWRWVMRCLGLFGLLYIPTYWLVPESPRWFLNQNRTKEAKEVFAQIAKTNDKEDMLEEVYSIIDNQRSKDYIKTSRKSITFQYKEIFTSWRMTVIFVTAVVAWTSVALLYFGLAFSAENLSENIFTNSVLLSLVEIPGIAVGYYAVKYLNRPISHSTMLFVSAAACFIAPFFKEVSSTAVLLFVSIGKTTVAGVYYVMYIHFAEVFPTMVRANFMAIASCGGRIGTILSPYLLNMMNVYGMFIPFLILSLLGVFAGAQVLLFLPDTRLEEVPETVQDTLNMKTVFNFCQKKKPVLDVKDEEKELALTAL